MVAMSCGLSAAVDAQAKPFEEPLTAIRLDGPWRGVDGRFHALLSVDLSPGWKTYWRAPGEAGVPPRFDWSASSGVDRVEVAWPAPRVFGSFGMRTYGYENAVAFPLVVTLAPVDDRARLVGEVTIGVCKEICVFSSERVELPLRGEAASSSFNKVSNERLAASRMLTPSSGADLGLQLRRCHQGEGYRARLDGVMAQNGWSLALVEDPSTGYVAEANIIEDEQTQIWLEAEWPSRLREAQPVVTLVGSHGAVELNGCAP